MNVVFIGSDFYFRSGTAMSSVYEDADGHLVRTDWGKIEIALAEGQEVHIRQAVDIELLWAYNLLTVLEHDKS